MINAGDMTIYGRAPITSASNRPITERILRFVLFITILSSAVVFIQPSPYEGLVGLLAIVYLIRGDAINRRVLPFIWLTLIWSLGGTLSVLPVLNHPDAVKAFGISIYLAVTGVLFACLFAQESEHRLSVMRNAYILTAVLSSIFGTAEYFRLIPGYDTFTWAERATSTFKDPNAYAPFLVLPLLFLVQTIVVRRATLRYLLATTVVILGLLLTFSRGGLSNFLFSATVMLTMIFLTTNSSRIRTRTLVAPLIVAVIGVAVMVSLLSSDTFAQLASQRTSLLQNYDTGESGRFGIQLRSLPLLLDHPNGLGPEQFGAVFYYAVHNTYLTAFSAYGWLGGIAYFVLVLSTVVIGVRYCFLASPVQDSLIPVTAAFFGLALEGFVIDTDHWRFFYLMAGTIWALVAVAAKHRSERSMVSPVF